MSGPSREPAPSEAVESAAAEWLALHDRGLTPAQQDAFLQWLAAAPEHRASFQRHQQMWADLNLLAHWRPEHSSTPNPGLLARPRRRNGLVRRAARPLAVAACIALVWTGWVFTRGGSSYTATFEATSYQQQQLPDGTSVEMNRDTSLVAQFSASERRILMVQGEAQFFVARDAGRPFIVRAGGVDVRAVGTAFNVRVAGSNIEVLVTEGVVQVAQKAPSVPAASPGVGDSRAVIERLTAGYRTIVPVVPATSPPPVMPVSSEEIERLLQWKPRLLDFDSTPLAEVVVEFNRRNSRQLVIGEAELQTLPIVASVRSDNVDGFVRTLEATFGVQAEPAASGNIVLRRRR
jgi:transmembrane sensor